MTKIKENFQMKPKFKKPTKFKKVIHLTTMVLNFEMQP